MPTLDVLTKVDVYIRDQYGLNNDYFTISLRDEIDGDDLSTETISITDIGEIFQWFGVDFPDSEVMVLDGDIIEEKNSK